MTFVRCVSLVSEEDMPVLNMREAGSPTPIRLPAVRVEWWNCYA